jgi:hypothetical protein
MRAGKNIRLLLVLLATILLTVAAAGRDARAEPGAVLFREDFTDLANWEPFYFPKIKKHTLYTIAQEEGRHYLKTESDGSASAIVYKTSFNVYDFPKARWRWKVENIFAKGDARTKAGDDYPIRVYVMFEYDPEKAGTFEKMKYGIAKSLYGAYPPHSSLSYVWASKEERDLIIESPYTDRAKMVLLEQGARHVAEWRDEEIDMVKDYEKAFGMKPPLRARIAVMNDSDNTAEHAVSYLEFLEVFR